jgi:type I restriction enzyme M protein
VFKTLATDPAAAFDLLLLVLAAKVLDEQSQGAVYEFAIIEGETAKQRSERFQTLLTAAQRWLDANVVAPMVVPSLPYNVVDSLLRLFQDWSFHLTADAAGGTDLLGTAYESIVGSTFRGELGSYFTPRTIADFMARLIDVRAGKLFDPACGSAGLLLAAKRLSDNGRPEAELQCFGNDLNPRMVRAARVNFLLHALDPEQITMGDGLRLDRVLGKWISAEIPSGPWWSSIPSGPFDAVLANPPFAGHESDQENLTRSETALKVDGGLRALNRTIPFLEAIVASLRIGGMAGLVIPTSVLNAEEESFVRFRTLLVGHVELVAIIGLPEKAFVHSDCGVHGALLFFRRVRKPRRDYDVFVDWAVNLGYDRLGRYRRENDFPAILTRYRNSPWPDENTFRLSYLTEQGRLDPAWLHIARSLPSAEVGDYVPLTDLATVRDARISRRLLADDDQYRYFEVSDANLDSGEIENVHETSGFELRKKGRIKNRVRTGDVLLPNHRDSLIAKGAPTGRSAVIVSEEHDGVLTTDRFLVLTPKVEPLLLQKLLNSAGVRRQIVAQCRGAASLDIRERILSAVLVPRLLVEGENAKDIVRGVSKVIDLRQALAMQEKMVTDVIENAFGSNQDFRPKGWRVL